MEYTSKGVGNAALATGVIGTALGALNGMGGLANLVGGGMVNTDPNEKPITRHDMELYQQINDQRMKIAELNAQNYTNQAVSGVQAQISAQAVWNATVGSNLNCLQNQIIQIQKMTQLGIPESNIIFPVQASIEGVTPSTAGGMTKPTNNG